MTRLVELIQHWQERPPMLSGTASDNRGVGGCMGPTMFHVKPKQLMGLGNRSGFHCHAAAQWATVKTQ